MIGSDFTRVLLISGIGLAGVFLFMAIFYGICLFIDRAFPADEEEE
jgi:hypothetical protein